MRRRLLQSSLVVLALAIVAFAVPLAIAVRGLLVDRSLDELQAGVEQAALIIDQRARNCREIQLFVAATGAQDTQVTLWSGGRLLASSSGRPEGVGAELAEAAAGRLGRAYTEGQLAVATPLASTLCGAPTALRAARSGDGLRRSVGTAWAGLGIVGLAVFAAATAAARWQGRRLAEPFEGLARTARRLGDGDFTVRAPRSGLPEADAIAEALDVTADRLGRALQRARAFTADASHQLRTPLTALRLHLEALAAGDADAATVVAALEEADRLDATVRELVTLTAPEGTDEPVELGEFVSRRLPPWQMAAQETGRELLFETLPCPPVKVRTAAVAQALHVLLDNALEHGQGTVTVRVGPSLPDSPLRGSRICVADEGPGFVAPDVRRTADRGGGPLPLSGGRGLALAHSLVESEGGQLVIASTEDGTRACIVFPAI